PPISSSERGPFGLPPQRAGGELQSNAAGLRGLAIHGEQPPAPPGESVNRPMGALAELRPCQVRATQDEPLPSPLLRRRAAYALAAWPCRKGRCGGGRPRRWPPPSGGVVRTTSERARGEHGGRRPARAADYRSRFLISMCGIPASSKMVP